MRNRRNGFFCVKFFLFQFYTKDCFELAGDIAGRMSGDIITNSDGSVLLDVRITGGIPKADTLTWTLPDGTTLNADQSRGTYVARTTVKC